MNKPLGVLVTERTISMIMNGKPISINNSHRNFEVIKEKVLRGDYENLQVLIDTETVLKENVQKIEGTSLSIERGVVKYKGQNINNILSEKLLSDFEAGYNITAFSKFVDNLMENPSSTAINELYLFIEKANLPLTEDGCFLAYKKVRTDYKDCYTGTIDNSVGQIVSMPRNQVDDIRTHTCSYGLHFCSYNYLSSFGSHDDKIMVVKINPKDVVSIPSDYDNTKGRTCSYEVVAEIESQADDLLTDSYGDAWISDDTPLVVHEISKKPIDSEKSDFPIWVSRKIIGKGHYAVADFGSLTIMENGAVVFKNVNGQFISRKRAEEIGLIEKLNELGLI